MPNTAENLPHFTPAEVAERRALARSFEASTIQEGYTPTDEDRALLRPLIDGEITEAEYFDRLAKRERAQRA
jgi:hypothetical protein